MRNIVIMIAFISCPVHGNELNEDRGEIASPMFPHTYNLDSVFTWRITVNPDRLIRMYFIQLSVGPADIETCVSDVSVGNNVKRLSPFVNAFLWRHRYLTVMMIILRYWDNIVEKLDQEP